jgi:hypothetical protein
MSENLGVVAIVRGDQALARSRLQQGWASDRALGDHTGWIRMVFRLGRVIHLARQRGEHEQAATMLRDSLTLARDVGHPWGMSESMRRFAKEAMLEGRAERAARLYGAAESIRKTNVPPLPPYPLASYQRDVAEVQSALGPAAFEALWAEGARMTMEQAITIALGEAAGETPAFWMAR